MKTLKILEEGGYIVLSSLGERVSVTNTEYDKIVSCQYDITKPGEDYVFTEKAEWADIVKQKDIEDFHKKDEYIDAIERKMARLEVRKLDDECTQENKDMMQVIIDNLTTESASKETEIQTLLTTMKTNHGLGIATDYANKLKSRLGG